MSPDGAGGWTADFPSTIRITLALSSLGVMSLPVEVPPSRQWIVLPNPGYGSWEEALYDTPKSPDAAERMRQKQRYLVLADSK